MSVILIDTKYIGIALKQARHENCLPRQAIADALHIPKSDLARYEHGRTIIPQDILTRLFRHGLYFHAMKK